jgi:ubiquinone/menaquinone biosynthesis C-methylase UbiE
MAAAAQTTTSFFTDGEAYERMMGQWSRAAGQQFLDWLAVPKGLRWVDVGCGTGAFTQLIFDRCAPHHVSAVDPAPDQIGYAKTKPIAKRVDFQIGDAHALPFPDRGFDAATMALVITFIADPAKAVSEMKRVVKPGGTLGTYMWDFIGRRFTQEPLRAAVEAAGIAVPPAPGHPNSTIENLERFFKGASLDDVATRTIEIELSYPSFDEYWSSQTALPNTVVQHIVKMSPPQVEKVKDHLRKTLPTDRNGRIAYMARANAVKGKVPK